MNGSGMDGWMFAAASACIMMTSKQVPGLQILHHFLLCYLFFFILQCSIRKGSLCRRLQRGVVVKKRKRKGELDDAVASRLSIKLLLSGNNKKFLIEMCVCVGGGARRYSYCKCRWCQNENIFKLSAPVILRYFFLCQAG